MFKTFIIGLVLGVGSAAGLLYAIPLVNQDREASIVAVAPNGGMLESFHVKIPVDRIMTGAQSDASPVPPGLEWPVDPLFSDVRSEMFKVRNARDLVVGVGVRTAARNGDENVVDWLLHLPAQLFPGQGRVLCSRPADLSGCWSSELLLRGAAWCSMLGAGSD